MKRRMTLHMMMFLTAALLSSTTVAVTVKNVELPEQVKIEQNTLVLNGAGIRSKFVFDIYVGALYLGNKMDNAQTIIADPGAKLVRMHFVYDEVSAEKMRNGWNDGFEKVLDDAGRKNLQTLIDSFNQAFGNTKAGDVIDVQYLPQTGTHVIVNGSTKATIPGVEFHQALMKIWLGDDPVDDDLKRGMLGKNKAE